MRRLSHNTIDARSRHLRWLVVYMDDCDASAVTTEDCESYYAHKGKTNGIASQFDIMVSVRNFFGFCQVKEIVPLSPAAFIPYPRITRRKPRIINETQAATLIDWAERDKSPHGLRNLAVISLGYGAGLRSAELSNVRLAEIDLQEHYCYINRSKWGIDRYAYFPEPTAMALQAYINNARPILLGKRKDKGFLFVSTHSAHLSKARIGGIVKTAASACGMPWVHTHILRHSFATHMLDHGTDIETLREALGHSSLAATGVYLQVANKSIRNKVQTNHPLSARHDQLLAVRAAEQMIVDRSGHL